MTPHDEDLLISKMVAELAKLGRELKVYAVMPPREGARYQAVLTVPPSAGDPGDDPADPAVYNATGKSRRGTLYRLMRKFWRGRMDIPRCREHCTGSVEYVKCGLPLGHLGMHDYNHACKWPRK